MVLAELGKQINGALHNFTSKAKMGDDDLKEFLNEVAKALLMADVNIAVVKRLQQQIRSEVSVADSAAGLDKRKIVQSALMRAVRSMVDPKVVPFVPKKGAVNVVMFVGLQGGGKTTSCTKYAAYFQKQGFKAALVCADTYRAGAYDQLRQNALKADVRFYGSITQTDPVQIAKEGVAALRKERYDLIVVDTSGRNKQEAALFEEMKQVEAAIKPQDIVYVLDGTNGQAVHEQAQEFKNKVKVGSVILTKMDCQTKGGGALSAVATTGSPIVFVGTGEHFDDFMKFDPDSFVSRMLGRGDVKGLAEMMKNMSPDFKETQKEMMTHLQEGTFSMRDLQETLQTLSSMGPMSKMLEMMPGLGGLAGPLGEMEKQGGGNQFKVFIHMMDSMTPRELDDPKIGKTMTASRIARIARGSGRSIQEVNNLMLIFSKFEELSKTMGKNGLKSLGSMSPAGLMNRNAQQTIGNMSKIIDPRVLQQMGGQKGLTNMLKQMGGGGLGGGGGGMPDMAEMMNMAKQMGGLGGLAGAMGGGGGGRGGGGKGKR